MLHGLRMLFYIGLVVGGAFLYWFLPKYSYISANPEFCTELFSHTYYCGSKADLTSMFSQSKPTVAGTKEVEATTEKSVPYTEPKQKAYEQPASNISPTSNSPTSINYNKGDVAPDTSSPMDLSGSKKTNSTPESK